MYPAFPYDAKGLLATAINDPNPVMFFEHKALYRSVYQDVPKDYYTIPFGQAALLRGDAVTVISFGAVSTGRLKRLTKTPKLKPMCLTFARCSRLIQGLSINRLRKQARL
ncbi:hypothetical protein [Flavobacterium sp. J372]|uniref:hypothetical protein n=1 Tax=Flavobacterium sp. J372 TaxID=2898436 RepID=UPI0027E323C0|nr:hypothetical protein [Flavobacterium sp. J372]